jgi:hypothetical protein
MKFIVSNILKFSSCLTEHTFVHVDSAVGSFYYVDVGSVAGISEVCAASILRVKVNRKMEATYSYTSEMMLPLATFSDAETQEQARHQQ